MACCFRFVFFLLLFPNCVHTLAEHRRQRIGDLADGQYIRLGFKFVA